MYVTVFKMDKQSILNSNKTLNLNSNYAIHRWITQQQDANRQKAELLYRVIYKADGIYLFVQSKEKFNRENCEDYGLVFLKEIDLKNMLEKISKDPELLLEFDVKTFPCKAVKEKHKHFFLKDQEDRFLWLEKQLNKFGAELLRCTEYQQQNHILDKFKIVKQPSASYKGILKVIDLEKFSSMISNGLGRTKTFGLGMFLIKPVKF